MRHFTSLGYCINILAMALSLYFLLSFGNEYALDSKKASMLLFKADPSSTLSMVSRALLYTLWLPLSVLAIWAISKNRHRFLLFCSLGFLASSIFQIQAYAFYFPWVYVLPTVINATLAVVCMQKAQGYYYRNGWLLVFANITALVSTLFLSSVVLLVMAPRSFRSMYLSPLTEPYFLLCVMSAIISACCLASLLLRKRRLFYGATIALAALILWLAAPTIRMMLFSFESLLFNEDPFLLAFFAILFGVILINFCKGPQKDTFSQKYPTPPHYSPGE